LGISLPFNQDATQNALKTVLASKGQGQAGVLDTRLVKQLINNGEGPEKGTTIEFEEGDSKIH
jgi:hypothetical protein